MNSVKTEDSVRFIIQQRDETEQEWLIDCDADLLEDAYDYFDDAVVGTDYAFIRMVDTSTGEVLCSLNRHRKDSL